MNKKHARKMTAPIVITVLFLLVFLAYGLLYISMDALPPGLRILMAIGMLALAVALVVVLIGRIREIKGGEEDDLGNY